MCWFFRKKMTLEFGIILQLLVWSSAKKVPNVALKMLVPNGWDSFLRLFCGQPGLGGTLVLLKALGQTLTFTWQGNVLHLLSRMFRQWQWPNKFRGAGCRNNGSAPSFLFFSNFHSRSGKCIHIISETTCEFLCNQRDILLTMSSIQKPQIIHKYSQPT